jgi:hypothetical protein
VPTHYHITEVGKVQKDFIDCGGTVRSSTACVLLSPPQFLYQCS